LFQLRMLRKIPNKYGYEEIPHEFLKTWGWSTSFCGKKDGREKRKMTRNERNFKKLFTE
jgi:hypothetical protein